MIAVADKFAISTLPVNEIVVGLEQHGALSLPLLNETFRHELLAEAQSVSFRPARESVGEGDRLVYQRMEVCNRFPRGSVFVALRDDFQALWDASFIECPDYPFETRVRFNDLMLQRYAPGEVGITPHRDRSGYRNVICLFVLAGRGRFGVCADRSGKNEREISNAPGEVILTRAPGFLGSNARPFHFVRDIVEPRYVFGLRQECR
ncbi:MAG TPA: hypothetical protein VLS27_18185 [Gammaproteobacteria bacterium]|nr:hypothetical protein [Gammaproteobacteria bacterium]